MTEKVKNSITKPLLRRYTDEQGNDMVAVAAWFYDQIIDLFNDEQPIIEGLTEAIDRVDQLNFVLHEDNIALNKVIEAARAYWNLQKRED